MRESELVSLDVHQYHSKGLHSVVRHKVKRVTYKIPLPQEAREHLDNYLNSRELESNEPLFINRSGNRINTRNIYRICQRVLRQVSALLNENEQFEFSPHKLRHTFLKKVTDKHGVHFAQELSGNVSIKEIFPYAKPSQVGEIELHIIPGGRLKVLIPSKSGKTKIEGAIYANYQTVIENCTELELYKIIEKILNMSPRE